MGAKINLSSNLLQLYHVLEARFRGKSTLRFRYILMRTAICKFKDAGFLAYNLFENGLNKLGMYVVI